LDKKQDEDILTIPKDNYNNNNINYFNKIKDYNDSNINKNNNTKIFNNMRIEHKIDFSLKSKKNNYLSLCSNKNKQNNKIDSRKTISKSKNSLNRFHLINKKLFHLHKISKNSNNSLYSQNKKNFSYNNNDINSFKTMTNYSPLKTNPNYENENPVFSTIKTINNCDFLSSTISNKSITAQNRVTLVSNSNYSNMITRASTSIKMFKYKTLFDSKKYDKIQKNAKKINYSNKLLFNKQKIEKGKKQIAKEKNNINYKNIFIFNKSINSKNNTINIKNKE
jgi:hypothetical protein